MAKECLNCRRKVGILSGEHFGGLLCDNCYNGFGGMTMLNLEMEDDPEKYMECYQKIVEAIDEKGGSSADREKIKQEFYKSIDSRYKTKFGKGMQEAIQRQLEEKEKQIERAKIAREKELKRVNFAQSFREFYEYDVVTIINENHGTIDKEKMMEILSEHARNGWKLHTIYSNELGKNALSIMGFGTNSTACEDVLIFERRVEEIE